MSTTAELTIAPYMKHRNGVLKTTTQDEVVSPQRAQMLIHTSAFDIQRKLKLNSVLAIANEMREGRYTTGVSNVAFCVLPDGRRLCINGQHLLHAVISSDTTQTINFRYYYVEDLQEARRIFCRFDYGRNRSEKDAFAAFDLVEETHLNATELGRLSSAVRWIELGFNRNNDTHVRGARELRIDALREWIEPARELFRAIAGGAARRPMEKRAVFSIGIVTFRYAYADAVDFWHQVAFDDGLPLNDPRKTLNRFLLSSKVSGVGVKRNAVTDEYFSRAVALCWNSYLRKEEKSIVRVVNEYGPILLLRTPYTGDQGS